MDVGDVWVTIRADTAQAEAGIESTKTKIGSMDPTIRETRKEFKGLLNDIRFLALPLTAGAIAWAAMYAEMSKLGERAQSIRKMSFELDITTEAAQRLQNAQKGLYNQPIFTDEEVRKLATIKSGYDSIGETIQVMIGKAWVWMNTVRPSYLSSTDFMGFQGVGDAAIDASKKGETFNKWLKKVADDAETAAERIKDAEQSMTDLSRSIEDREYSTAGERFTQAGLTTEYSELEKELAGLDPAIYGDTATIAATAARRKEILARMERIQYEQFGSQRTVNRNTEDIAAARGAGEVYVRLIVEDRTIGGVAAQIEEMQRDMAWLIENRPGSY